MTLFAKKLEKDSLRHLVLAVFTFIVIFDMGLGFLNIDLRVVILTPMRLVSLLLSLFFFGNQVLAFIKERTLPRWGRYRYFALLYFMAMAVYGLFWLFFGETNMISRTEIMGVIFITSNLYCYVNLVRDRKDLRFFLQWLVVCGILLAILASIECVTGSFFPHGAYNISLEEKISRKQTLFPPSVVFGNTNDLASILFLCLALVGNFFLHAKSQKKEAICFGIMLLLLLPTPMISSTIFELCFCFLTVLLMVLVFFFHRRNRRTMVRKLFFLLALLALYQLVYLPLIRWTFIRLNSLYYDSLIRTYLQTHPMAGLENLDLEILGNNTVYATDSFGSQIKNFGNGYGTIHYRFWLIVAGLSFFLSHPILGVGPGNYRSMLESNAYFFQQTSGIIDPHNFYMELLSQYGLLFFLPMLYFYVKLFLHGLHLIRRREGRDQRYFGSLLLLLLICCALICVLPSSMLRFSAFWLFFIALVLAADLTPTGAAEAERGDKELE